MSTSASVSLDWAHVQSDLPVYRAPEQFKDGQPADIREDVYSYGATFYHVLSGRPPLLASGYGELLKIVGNVDPPLLLEIAPGTPPELAAVIDGTLGLDPRSRYQDMNAVMTELGTIREAMGL